MIEVAEREMTVTSPGKVFFSERGDTKLDLVGVLPRSRRAVPARGGRAADSHAAVPTRRRGQLVLPEARSDNAPEWLQTTIVTTPNRTTSRALVLADMAHVVWAVNLACLGFHVWPHRHDSQVADEAAPGPRSATEVGFEEARAAAAEVRRLLDELGMVGYPKTTGNRGLHVYVPLEPRWDSYRVRFAAVAIARGSSAAPRVDHQRGGRRSAGSGSSSTTTRTRRTRRSSAPGRFARVRPGLGAGGVGRDRLDPSGRAHDRERAQAARGRRRPMGGLDRQPSVARAGARASRARPGRGPHGRTLAARLSKQPDEPPRVAPSRARQDNE